MKIRFLANSMNEYQGSDNEGGALSMKQGDQIELSDDLGQALIRHYPRDFVECDEDKEHGPDSNKMAKKTSKFKSK